MLCLSTGGRRSTLRSVPSNSGQPFFRFSVYGLERSRERIILGVPLRLQPRQSLDRFPSIVEAAARIKATSFLIDGEVVIAGEDGMSDFRALRSKRRGPEAVLFAFDLLQHDGADLRENLSSAPYHRARASKSFPSRICGRLGGSDGRWFLPRTHR